MCIRVLKRACIHQRMHDTVHQWALGMQTLHTAALDQTTGETYEEVTGKGNLLLHQALRPPFGRRVEADRQGMERCVSYTSGKGGQH